MELIALIKDYLATELLSSIELDFLEEELWETTQHIVKNTVIKALKYIRNYTYMKIMMEIIFCSRA